MRKRFIVMLFLFFLLANNVDSQSVSRERYISPLRMQIVFSGPLRKMKEVERNALKKAIQTGTDKLYAKCASELFAKDSTVHEDFLTNLDSLDWLKITNIMFDAKIIFDENKKRYVRKGERVRSLIYTHPNLFTQRSRVVMEIIYQKHPELKLRKKGFLLIPFGFCEYNTEINPYGSPMIKGLLGNLVLNLETNRIGCNVQLIYYNHRGEARVAYDYLCSLLIH